MPWCEDCSKYLPPSALTDTGACPTCGAQVGDLADTGVAAPASTSDVAVEATPWHFKLLVTLLVIYLGYRFVQIFI